jgi:iron complex transport system substrate-binding protein
MFFRRCASALALILALILSACGTAAVPTTQAPTLAPTIAPPTSAPTEAPTSAPTAAPAQVPTSEPTEDATSDVIGLTITDVAGRTVTIGASPERIVSLAPSNTEILFALDLGPEVVAADDFSDFPAEVKSLPKIGGSSGSYNFEQIVALKPDLVLAAGITPPEAIKKLEELKLTVVVLGTPQTTFDSISSDITMVGQITGQTDEASQLTGAMKQKYEAIKAKVATATSRPRVYWELDGTDPAKPYSVGPGSFVGDLVGLAGGANIFEQASSPFPQVSAEQVVAANPEVIILADAAYGVTVASVMQRPGWQAIAAVKQQRVAPIDDNLISRPGPRIVEGLEAAAKIIHPELFK